MWLRMLILLAIPLLMAFPFLPFESVPFTFRSLQYEKGKHYKNLPYLVLSAVLAGVVMWFMPRLLDWFDAAFEGEIGQQIMRIIPGYAQYSISLLKAVFANVIYLLVALAVFAAYAGIDGIIRFFIRIFVKIRALITRNKDQGKRESTVSEKKETDSEELSDRAKGFFSGIWRNRRVKKGVDKKAGDKTENNVLPEYLLPKPEKEVDLTKVKVQTFSKEETITPPKNRKEADTNAESSGEYLEEKTHGIKSIIKKIRLFLRTTFYEEDEDKNWKSKPQSYKISCHLGNFLLLTGGLYLVLFFVMLLPVFFRIQFLPDGIYRLFSRIAQWSYLYPSVAMVFLFEVYLYLHDPMVIFPPQIVNQREMKTHVRIVDTQAVEKSIYDVCAADYDVTKLESNNVDMPQPISVTEDEKNDPLIRDIITIVERQGLTVTKEYLEAARCLRNGEHVLFDAPLYTSVHPYVFTWVNTLLARGESVVVVCPDRGRDNISYICEVLTEGFMRTLRIHKPIWTIRTSKDLHSAGNGDLLVATPGELCDERLYRGMNAFFERVSLVWIPRADQILQSDNYACLIFAETIRKISHQYVQFLFLTENHELNLANSLYQYFRLDRPIHEASSRYGFGNNVNVYIWKKHEQSDIVLDSDARNESIEVQISDTAYRAGIPDINMTSRKAVFADQAFPKWLDTYDASRRPVGFAVIGDDEYNLPNAINTYSKYIGKQVSIVHIITRPYLLRDYFVSQAQRYLYEEPLMGRGITEHADPQNVKNILLLSQLLDGIEVNELATRMRELVAAKNIPDSVIEYDSIRVMVSDCIHAALKNTDYTITEDQIIIETRSDSLYRKKTYVRLERDGILPKLAEETMPVRVRFTGGRSEACLDLFRRMLAQRFLPGQNLVLDNRNYEIKEIDYENGIIEADDSDIEHGHRSDYIQIRRYKMLDCDQFRNICEAVSMEEPWGEEDWSQDQVKTARLRINSEDGVLKGLTSIRGEGILKLQSDTVGYYMVRADADQINLNDISVTQRRFNSSEMAKLRRFPDRVLYLRLDGDFIRSDEMTLTLAVLLQEMMKTLFPRYYFCVAVLPILQNPEYLRESDERISGIIADIYSYAEGWEPATDHCLELLIVDDCSGGTGILDLLYSPESGYLQNIFDMLYHYLCWQDDHEEVPYYYFGSKKTPEIYDVYGVRQLLQPFSYRYRHASDQKKRLNAKKRCCFCGRELMPAEEVKKDVNQVCCKPCLDEYVPDEKEAEEILSYVRDWLKKTYKVSIKQNLHIIQVSQDQILKDQFSTMSIQEGTIRLLQDLPLTTVHEQLLSQMILLWQRENLSDNGDNRLAGQVPYELEQYLKHLKQYERAQRLAIHIGEKNSHEADGYRALTQELLKGWGKNSFLCLLEGRQAIPRKEKPSNKEKPGGVDDPHEKDEPGSNDGKEDKGRQGSPENRDIKEKQETKVSNVKNEVKEKNKTGQKTSLVKGKCKRKKEADVPWFYYSRLNGDRRILYEKYLATILGMEKKLDLDGLKITSQDLDEITTMILYEHPEIFWTAGCSYSSNEEGITSIVPTYLMENSEREEREKDIQEASRKFLSYVTEDMDEYEAALKLYEVMAQELDYDGLVLNQIKQLEPQSAGQNDIYSIYGALVQKRAVCSGYAKAYMYLLRKVGIQSIYVAGTSINGGRHAWNIVNMDHVYCHVDVTWGDHSNTDQKVSSNGMNYTQFGLTDEQIRRTRVMDHCPERPLCVSDRCNYYIREGLYFKEYDTDRIREVMKECFLPNGKMEIQFVDKKLFNSAIERLMEQGEIYTLFKEAGCMNAARIKYWTDRELYVLMIEGV